MEQSDETAHRSPMAGVQARDMAQSTAAIVAKSRTKARFGRRAPHDGDFVAAHAFGLFLEALAPLPASLRFAP
jgi:hypothetical protein